MARTPDINVRVNVLFGWRCTECGATGESSPYIGSQSDLDTHWLVAHGSPLPPYEEAPPDENFWDDRTIPASDPSKPASLDYAKGVRDALDVIAEGLKRNGKVDPEDIYQTRVKFYGGDR